MTIKSILTILGLLLSSAALAIVPPDNSTTSQIKLVDRVTAVMNDVDDVGMLIVWNGQGAMTALQCEWASGGRHGSISGDISSHLTLGDNYIIFVLYNKVYKGGILFAGGKWSFRFTLNKNGKSVWNKAKHVTGNSPGIKYWKVIKATVSQEGYVTISSDRIASEMMKLLSQGMRELEVTLGQSLMPATPF